MRWEENLLALFDDLEMQADGLYLEQRRDEVDSLAEAGYAEVTLASRLHASLGVEARFRLTSGAEVRGRLTRVGDGWVLVSSGPGSWLIQLPAVTSASGLLAASTPASLWPVTARLTVRSVLRGIANVGDPCAIWQTDGHQVSGLLGRVGSDFLELSTGLEVLVLPIASLAAVRELRGGR